MRPIKVLVVDDSVLIHEFMKIIFYEEPNFEIIAFANNGKMALEALSRYGPDVITLDIEMPEMDGLETLSRIMSQKPTPIVMLTSFSKEEAELTFNALDCGAVDFITKPHPFFSRSILDIKYEILAKVEAASKVKVKKIDLKFLQESQRKIKKIKKDILYQNKKKDKKCSHIVSIGASTGGPKALQVIIPSIPKDISAGFLIVQHMPAGYTRAFANRLDRLSSITVKEAGARNPILPGIAYIARGDLQLMVKRYKNDFLTVLKDDTTISKFQPSIDVTMKSTAENFKKNTIGVIMTGMCNDGVEGVRHIKKNEGKVIAQDEKTSLIFGMNQLAIESGYVDKIVPLENIISTIISFINM